MSWESDLDRFTMKLDQKDRALVPALTSAAYESIVEGSPVTGAPGQPVGQYGPGYHEGEVGGDLRTSWQVEFPDGEHGRVITKSLHAMQNEDGITRLKGGALGGPYVQRSSVGGRHSVKLTIMNWPRLVDHVVGGRLEGFQDNSVLGGSGS